MFSVILVLGLVRNCTQCLSKSAATEEEYQAPAHIKPSEFKRELPQLRSVQSSLFQPPQQILYGFTPVSAENRENAQSEERKESYQPRKELRHANIELINIPGPPYENQIHDHPKFKESIKPQRQSSRHKIASNVVKNRGQSFFTNKEKIINPLNTDQTSNNLYDGKSKQHTPRTKLHRGSSKRIYHQIDPFKDEIQTQEDLKRNIKNSGFQKFQTFPGFDSFHIDLERDQSEN